MKKLLLCVFAAFAFAACEQAPIEELSGVRTDAPETIKVGFEDDETRIQLNGAQKTVWTKGDQVSVFYLSDANQKWQYNGETGTRTAELKRVAAGNATETMKRVVVVYPYNDNYYINTDTYNVKASLPAVQNYLKDSYGTNGNIMISSSEYNQFSLKSVCGWLKLQLTGDGETIKSIKFRGNDGEQVAGELYINSVDASAALASDMGNTDDNNAGGSLVFDDTILTEVILDCGNGVTLGKNATAFYIALPPQSFAKGFTVEIEDSEGYIMEQSTAKVFVIDRNTISPMSAFEFINPNRPTEPVPANNEIWYTATAEVEPYFDDSITFGANVISNVWDSETKRGIITFDGNIIMIGELAFNDCDNLTTITLPEIVTTIYENAFYDCDGLVEITIPDSVTTIGDYAFQSCGKLISVAMGNSVTTIGEGAFSTCPSLTSVNIPDSVIAIGENAFSNCNKLKMFTGKFAEDGGRILVIDGTLIAFAPYEITDYVIPNNVTGFREGVFRKCDNLISVTIPDSVTSIASSVFENCTRLRNITLGNSITTIGFNAFSGCSNLVEVIIPNSVTEISTQAFGHCISLTEITIPSNVRSIGYGAFHYCSSLKKIYCQTITPPIKTSVSSTYGWRAFSDNAQGRRIYVYSECIEAYKTAWSDYKDSIVANINLPNSETTTIYYTTTDDQIINANKLPIKSNTYNNGVGEMVIWGDLKFLPNNVFSSCETLINITIPNSVFEIAEDAFRYCTSLTDIVIPDNVMSIGDEAFYNCSRLTSVTIGKGLMHIGTYAFRYCDNLKSIHIQDISSWCNIKSIDSYLTHNGKKLYCNNELVTNVNIPDGILEVGPAFSGFDHIISVIIPNSAIKIKNGAFSSCKGLTNVYLGNNITTIGIGCFSDCSNLESITIPNSVNIIGTGAFDNCDKLKDIYCKPCIPPLITNELDGLWTSHMDIFSNHADEFNIYVPASSLDKYKIAKGWNEHQGCIFEDISL